MAKRFLEKQREDGSTIYQIDRQKKTGVYYLNPDCSQAKYVTMISLHGFERLPTGLYSKGFGFTNAGSWLVSSLGKQFGSKLKLTISSVNPSNIKKTKTAVNVTINHNRLSAANNVVRGIKKDRNDQIRSVIDSFLAINFPNMDPKLAFCV